MSIISSKQVQKQSLVDILFVCLVLTLILAALVPSSENVYNPIRTAPGVSHIADDISTGAAASFAADKQYWNAHCSHGWSSDARCGTIVMKTQSCSISLKSAYCSQYKDYLQELLSK